MVHALVGETRVLLQIFVHDEPIFYVVLTIILTMHC